MDVKFLKDEEVVETPDFSKLVLLRKETYKGKLPLPKGKKFVDPNAFDRLMAQARKWAEEAKAEVAKKEKVSFV